MPALGNKHSTLATEWLKDGICILSFLIPEHSQNVITQQFLNELSAALAEIKVGPQPSGLVLMSRRAGSFFAGADLLRLEQLRQASSSEIVRACAAWRLPRRRLGIGAGLRPTDCNNRCSDCAGFSGSEVGPSARLGRHRAIGALDWSGARR